MKIQELLTKHKDNLFHKDVSEIEYINWIVFGYELDGKRLMPHTRFSLSDLLFSTPFLSLLQWKMENYLRCKLTVDDVVLDSQWQPHDRSTTRQFDSKTIHKINLALLNTDEERISYLENNTI